MHRSCPLDLVPGRSGKAYAARLRDQVVDAVVRSGRAVSETAAAFAVSWWTVRAALTEAITVLDAFHVVKLG
jgi:hypothetical protein